LHATAQVGPVLFWPPSVKSSVHGFLSFWPDVNSPFASDAGRVPPLIGERRKLTGFRVFFSFFFDAR